MAQDAQDRTLTYWPLPTVEPRAYQVDALNSMLDRGNQLLALTMGAGKTLTAIAAVEVLADQGDVSTGFVFAPNSVKFQWLEEIRSKTRAPCQVIDGTQAQRRFQYKHARRFRYNIANYDSLRNDTDMIRHFYGVPDFIIADEATQIKSFKAKRSKALKAWARDVPYRFALTGQPIENRPEELFSIMEFVDRTVLGSFKKFDQTFILRDHWGRPTRYRNMDTLRRTMETAMFRRSRKDIENYLPKIITMEVPVTLSPTVMALYEYISEDCLAQIDAALEAGNMGGFDLMAAYGRSDRDDGGKARGEIMSRMTCMRLLCDHPHLLLRSADNYDDDDTPTGSKYASWLKEYDYLLPFQSGGQAGDNLKLSTAVELIEQIVTESPDNRVVLFSYFKQMLQMIGIVLSALKIPVTYLTGDMDTQARRDSLNRFKGPVHVLLSSDAGQYGVDLPHVNYLISYDLPWSAGAYAQRVARIDRTSSLFPHVTVVTLMAKNTIEQRQFDMLTQKRQVAEAWIDGQHIDAKGGLSLSLETLRQFLAGA